MPIETRSVVVAIFLAGLLGAQAQGTLVFRVPMDGAAMVPAVVTPAVGGGRLELTGSMLHYSVGLQASWFDPIGASLHGPALLGEVAPMIFDLGQRFVVPGPDSTLRYQFIGDVELTPLQVDDLVAGLWYVKMNSVQYPEGHLRGQVILVPEPTVTQLLLGGLGVMLAAAGRRWCRARLAPS